VIVPSRKGIAIPIFVWNHCKLELQALKESDPELVDAVACGTGILQHQNQTDYFDCLECNPFWSPFDPVVLPPCFCPKQSEDNEEIRDDDETEEDRMVAAAAAAETPLSSLALFDDLFDLISPPVTAPTSAADETSKGLKRPLENPDMPKKKKKSVAKTDAL
jgi:hypothetical protein